MTNKLTNKILVTDCWTRKSLSCIRSLGIMNLEVHAVNNSFFSAPIHSRYVNKIFIIPDAKRNPEEYKRKILEILKKDKYGCIIALEDESIKVLLEIKDEIEKYTNFPMVFAEKFNRAFDKWESIKIAKKMKIPFPESYLPENEKEIEEVIKKLGFPLIIKPRMSSGSRGISKVNNAEEFKENYYEIRKKYGNPIIQKCLDSRGQGLGCGVLFDGKKTIANFSYKRLREYPVNGGPSTLRESTNNEEIKKYSEKLLKKLDWKGLAMIEFKIDINDGKPKFIEINPRVWGSIELAQASGINFPGLLYKMSIGEKIEEQNYNIGVRCRWLAGDILHFFGNKNRFKIKFFNFLDKNTKWDEFRKDDIIGSIASVFYTFLSIFDINMWRLGIFRK